MTATLPNARVHWVACTDSSRNIPLGAFAQWVGEGGADNPAGQIASARRALLAEGDLVIGVDDAHLIDPLSATLLHTIATERAGRIVATVRNTEQVPEVIMSLWKDGFLQWLELRPFTRDETTALLEDAGAQYPEIAGTSAAWIWFAAADYSKFGVYSATPPPGGFRWADVQDLVDREPTRAEDADFAGVGTLESWTASFDRDGRPDKAFLAVRTPAEARALAVITDPDGAAALIESADPAGAKVRVQPDGSAELI